MDMSEYEGLGEACFGEDHKNSSVLNKCMSRFVAGWAVGGQVFVLG